MKDDSERQSWSDVFVAMALIAAVLVLTCSFAKAQQAYTYLLIQFVNCCGVDALVYSTTSNLTYDNCMARGQKWLQMAGKTQQNFICMKRAPTVK